MNIPFKMITETEIEKYRRDTWNTKEPETCAWINSFSDDAVFLDIGANIGIYSLLCAAVHKDSIIYAVEPSTMNITRLICNAYLNSFRNINTVRLCLSDHVGKDAFYIPVAETGASGGQCAISQGPSQRVEIVDTMTLDSFVLATQCPNHIKIDVDGQESKIIAGALDTLMYGKVESILIEINDNREFIYTKLFNAGFTDENEFNRMENHSRVRRQQEGINCENVIFTRG